MRLIHSAAGLCMMLLACSVHTETMAASQKVNVGAADAQERAGVGQRGGASDRNIGRIMVGTQDVEFGQVIDAQGLQDLHAEGGEELTKGGCADGLYEGKNLDESAEMRPGQVGLTGMPKPPARGTAMVDVCSYNDGTRWTK